MKSDVIRALMASFECHAQETEEGVEYWLARDLQYLLAYTKWVNFLKVVSKAKIACENSGRKISHHFADVGKMVDIGSGTRREVSDLMLTRYACYLIAQNGDPKKQDVAFAQTYFAVRTRQAELIERRLLEAERVTVRKKLTKTERELSQVIYEQVSGNDDSGMIRSRGDQALFGKTTREMKAYWRVPVNRPLADFAPTIVLKAKDFAAEITIFNAREGHMETSDTITREHITNNEAVRNTLLERGIRPENLSPVEDVKKVERRLVAEEKKTLTDSDSLD